MKDPAVERAPFFAIGIVVAALIATLAGLTRPECSPPETVLDTIVVDSRAGWTSCPPGTEHPKGYSR